MLENDVRATRLRLGWSQEDLASRSGVSRAGISAIETGRLVPSTAAALALAAAMGTTVEALFRLPGTRAAGDGEAWAWAPPRCPVGTGGPRSAAGCLSTRSRSRRWAWSRTTGRRTGGPGDGTVGPVADAGRGLLRPRGGPAGRRAGAAGGDAAARPARSSGAALDLLDPGWCTPPASTWRGPMAGGECPGDPVEAGGSWARAQRLEPAARRRLGRGHRAGPRAGAGLDPRGRRRAAAMGLREPGSGAGNASTSCWGPRDRGGRRAAGPGRSTIAASPARSGSRGRRRDLPAAGGRRGRPPLPQRPARGL